MSFSVDLGRLGGTREICCYYEAPRAGGGGAGGGWTRRVSLRRDEAAGRRPGRRVSRVLDAQVDVLFRLAEEVVYLLHGAERTDLLLGAVGDEPPGGAGRPSTAPGVLDDVRVAVRVDRARSRSRRSQQPPAVTVQMELPAIVLAHLQFRIFEVYV